MPASSNKLQGEWAEVCFMARAMRLGLVVSKPYGDTAPYDFIIESGARRAFLRVQVKSATFLDSKGACYRIVSGSGRQKRHYSPAEIDVLAAWVIPEDAWYIIPVAAFAPRQTVCLCPHRPSRRRYEQYREAWHRLSPGAASPGWS